MDHILKFVASFAVVALAAAVSAYFSYQGINTFYNTLVLPPLNPPNVVFPFVWRILYVLMIVSFYMILVRPQNQNATFLFLGQLVLHILWCYLFFVKALFAFAFVDLVLLILTLLAMIKQFYQLNHFSAYLQYPYFLWLLFAAYLNAGIWYLNGASLM